jgi:lipopolysaccharide export system protein LptA
MISSFVFTAEVKLTSDRAVADEANLKISFIGNVVITKEEDKLKADTVTVIFNKQQDPLKYEAAGNISIDIVMNKKRYHANGDNLLYDVLLNRYTLTKNAFLEEVDTNRKIYGDTIVVDQNNGTYTVDGSAEPVKFIFQIDDKKD